MRRGVILGIIGLGLVAGSLSLQSTSPVAFSTTKKIRPLIQNARLTKPLIFDRGALRLDPAIGGAGMTEARAFAVWQAQGGGGSYQITPDLDVFLARATIRPLPMQDPTEDAAPTLIGRLTWVFIWNIGFHHCGTYIPLPGESPTPPPTYDAPPNIPMELIAADSSGQGVSYVTRGNLCGEAPHGPTAQAATYTLSIPWQIIKVTPRPCNAIADITPCGFLKNAEIRASIPPCARSSGHASGGGSGGSTLWVFAQVPMTGEKCSSGATEEVIKISIAGNPPAPAIGLTQGGYQSGPNVLDYFDGAKHTIRVSES